MLNFSDLTRTGVAHSPPQTTIHHFPTSCLLILSKISEKFVTNRLCKYLDTNHLLYKHQYGFQSGRSTLHPLLHIVDFIPKALNDNEIVVAVFLDLQKHLIW